MTVVSPGGAVMVTGMCTVLVLSIVCIVRFTFFWLSESSGFSSTGLRLPGACRGVEARVPGSVSA